MRKRGGMRATVILLVALLSMSGQLASEGTSSAAAESATKRTSASSEFDFTSNKEPIHIRSHDLEFFYNEKRIVYRGAVVATQGNSTLKSNTLTVTYEDQVATPAQGSSTDAPAQGSPQKTPAKGSAAATTKGQKIKEIVAEENVEITSDTRRATCNKAVFSDQTRTIVLSGNAVLHDGENEVTGQKVTIYVDEGRTTVEGDPKMTFIPKQDNQEKKGEGKQ